MTDYSSTGGTAASGSMQTRTITAFFDRKADADRAVQALVDEGFDRSRIRMMPGNERDTTSGSSVRRPTVRALALRAATPASGKAWRTSSSPTGTVTSTPRG